MRYLLLAFGVTVLAVMLIAGKRGDMSRRPPIEVIPDMDRQPKLRPQDGNDFFKDGFSSQAHVVGTVARGSTYADIPENTGRVTGITNFIPAIPIPVTAQLMARGQERYNINCAPCHGAQGDGKGITSKLGMTVIADLHDVTTRKVPQQSDGELFNTITHGKGLMLGYAYTLTPEDRWAVIAYVRALQRSHLGSEEEVPVAERGALKKK